MATGGAGLAYVRYVEPYWAAIERVPLDLPRLHPDLVGFRIVQLSDLHVTGDVSTQHVRSAVQRVRELAPDLVVMTGDYITSGQPRHTQRLATALRELDAPRGVFAVLGNHDYGVSRPGQHRFTHVISRNVVRVLQDCGVRILQNAHVEVRRGAGSFQLIGLEDIWGGGCNVQAAFHNTRTDMPGIVLVHNPDAIDVLSQQDWDWMLCGHTHGGQVRIPLFGAPILPVRHREYDAGLFRFGRRRIYVNRGLGNILPVRFNCRPEITLFTLQPRDERQLA